MRKYGLKIDVPKETDYKFGSSPVPYTELQTDGQWSQFLPVKEFQNLQGVEPFACVSFTILNCVETLISRLYQKDKNFSDRFLASISGTSYGGNSPNVVGDFLRKVGVVDEILYPFSSDIDTFEKYYAPVSPKLYELARAFLNEYDFKYEAVQSTPEEIKKALTCSPLLFTVSAWFQNRTGLFFNPEGMQNNHATTLIGYKDKEYWLVFDSYADNEGEAIKKVAWDSLPLICKRFYIKKKGTQEKIKVNWAIDLIYQLSDLSKTVLKTGWNDFKSVVLSVFKHRD